MSKYEELETFVRIVEAGTITGAAEQMRVAKSAVSRRLKELEARLGTQLLTRSTRQLTLTENGQSLYDRATTLLADWQELESTIRDDQCALSGHIRFAAPLSFGVTHLTPAILDFMADNPEVTFDIDFNDRKVDMIADGIDVAIRIGVLDDSSLIARKIAPVNMVCAASPDYVAKHGTPTTIEELKSHREIRYGNRPSTSWSYTDPDGVKGTVTLDACITATNGDFLKLAAIAGQGIVIEPRFIIYEALREGSLVELLPDHQWPQLNAYAVYPPTRHLSRRVRAFVDFLVERFKGVPYWEG